MKTFTSLMLASCMLVGAGAAHATDLKEESLEAYNARMDWFARAQYGMFIHFGLYSHLGGEWNGEKVEWYAEWIQASRNIPAEEYAEIIDVFRFDKGRKQEYIACQTHQIKELIQKYDPDLLWFDGDWVSWWTLDDGIELYNTICEASPDIIVINRVAKRSRFQLDYVTQEQQHFATHFPNHWEGCYTMNKSWGYKKHDQNWKSAQTIYDKLEDINQKGGNLLLNVGPDGNGEIQPGSVALLLKTAELLKAKPITKRIPQIVEVPGIIEK